MIAEWLVFCVTVLFAYFWYTHKKTRDDMKEKGIKFLPGIPVFGNSYKSMLSKRHMWYDIDEVYRAFPGERYVGYFEGTISIVLIRDPELIKAITVKDFDHFVNHRNFFNDDVDPLFGGSLFSMKDDKWRDMRTTLSPAFTGSKMRLMMPFMNDISINIVEHLKQHQSEIIDIDGMMRRYTNDVIASAGFGLQINSLEDENNQFYKTGQTLLTFTTYQKFILLLVQQFPGLAKKFGLTVFPKKTTEFFRTLVKGTMDHREKNAIVRPDMIQLLMEASKGTLKHNLIADEKDKDVGFATTEELLKPKTNLRKWTQDELTAQAFIFFAAGFESAASAIVMTIHELALNPKVQDKLYAEIKNFRLKHSNITYDNVTELKYLDCVMNESFRKWSAALILDRVCLKSYELPPPHEGGKPYMLKPGDLVYNCVNPIHRDELYYPDPETFDPERFSDENRHNIQPFTFMPFGSGPRNCIGSRFAILELKVLLFHLISTFNIIKCEKTSDPIQLGSKDFNLKDRNGTWVKIEARE